MVRSCVAKGCKSRYRRESGITFHRFPSEGTISNQWVEAMKREKFIPKKHSTLCSEHFTKDDFVYNFGLKTVKPGVIPSVFNSLPQDSKKSIKALPLDAHLNKDVTGETHGGTELAMCMIKQEEISESEETLENFEFIDVAENSGLEHYDISTMEITQCKKRKRSQPVYMGDISEEDLNDPVKVRKMWQIAKATIERHKKTISYLQTKVSRQNKKIQSLQDLVKHLKSNNQNTSD